MSDWARTGEPDALVRGLDGLLFFPVTAFDEGGRFNPEAHRRRLARLMEAGNRVVRDR
jgi:dihydrodipicolinate synthase/N-acetylneuraminate lyase